MIKGFLKVMQKFLQIVLFMACTNLILASQLGPIIIQDIKAKILKGSANGAVYMSVKNNYGVDLKLIAASCDIAEKVELHDHIQDACGNSQMVMVENIIIPPHGNITLKKGGLHLMLMNLKPAAYQQSSIKVILSFSKASGEKINMEINCPVINVAPCNCNNF